MGHELVLRWEKLPIFPSGGPSRNHGRSKSGPGGNELDSSRFTCFRPQHTTVANIQTPQVYTNTIRNQSEENTPANWLKIVFRDFYVVIVQL